MKNCLQSVFGISPLETVEGFVTQYVLNGAKLIPEDWYKNCSEESAPSSLRMEHSYDEYAFNLD